jgi:endonuclease G, mitochondrial
MGWLGSVLSSVGHGLSDAGKAVVHGAEDGAKAVASGAKDGAKAVASGVEDNWKSAFNDAKAAAGVLGTGVRSLDAAQEQLGSWIDSGEKDLTNKIDEGRAWLRQHGGVVGQMASDQIGFAEGVGESLYSAGKGLVQLANTAGSLASPIEWAANPSANIARLKSTVNTVETLGRISNLANPTSWMTNPQGNEQLAGALWHSAATSFEKDPAEFIGNAAGTIGTMFIPGADAAGAAGDAGRVTELATDASKVATITGDVSKAAVVTQDASRAGAITQDASRAITQDASSAITQDASKAGAITDGSRAVVERGLPEAGKSGEAVARSEETAARTEDAVALQLRGSSRSRNAIPAGAIDKAFAGALDEFPGGVPPKILNPKLAEKVHDISNGDYAVTYSGVSRTPLVSSERITKESIEQAASTGRRTNDFRADLRLPADERSELGDYKGFIHIDRGHMAPHGDMSTRPAGSESFLLSNMVPQAANQNEGVWERIESGVRAATGAGNAGDPGRDIYVATGPAFIGNNLQSLNGRVLIPTDTWKAVYIPAEDKMGVYWVPNKNTVTAHDIETISVNELQRRIGIDVFPSVTDRTLRDQAEVPPIAEQGRFGGRIKQRDVSADDLTKHN